MTDNTDPNSLEAARERLEASLLKLSGRIQAREILKQDQHQRIATLEEAVHRLEAQKNQLIDELEESLSKNVAQSHADTASSGITAQELQALKEDMQTKLQTSQDHAKTMEAENTRLHAQIAASALDDPSGDAEIRAELASLRAEKKMLTERYTALKQDFAVIEAKNQALEAGVEPLPLGAAPDATAIAESEEKVIALSDRVTELENERELVKKTLDAGIAQLEDVLKVGEA